MPSVSLRALCLHALSLHALPCALSPCTLSPSARSPCKLSHSARSPCTLSLRALLEISPLECPLTFTQILYLFAIKIVSFQHRKRMSSRKPFFSPFFFLVFFKCVRARLSLLKNYKQYYGSVNLARTPCTSTS